MKNGHRLSGVFSALLLAGALAPPAATAATEAASEATIAAHVDAATKAAGADLKPLLSLCKAAPASRPPQAESDRGIAALINKPAPPPGQAFDNLFYIGADWVSAWALKTSDGIVLIDALNNEAEAAALIEGGMHKLGLDPAQIKYVIVTHGHGDHYGGAQYLAQKYKPRVVMSELDWKMTETKLEFATPLWGAPPKRDMAVNDGDRITLGDTAVTLFLTPGHTLGTITPVFDVATGGRKVRAMLWGGTAFNFGRDIPRLESYIEATRRMSAVAKEQKIEVLLSNHAGYDGALTKLAALRQTPGLQPNPFVLGNEGVLRALDVMGECAQAQRDRFTLK
jgi:metallo-beta-lactamase class B